MLIIAANLFTSYIIPFFFVLSLLIFVHELGHFLLAKLTGIRVERFSIGYPPRLFGKQIGDTDYCVSATPFGGYVKLSGMIDESMDTESVKGEPWEVMSKPVWARSLVIAAGPIFNVLLTVLVFSVGTFMAGIPETIGPVVGHVVDNMPAKAAGLQENDKILTVDQKPIGSWDQLVEIIHAAPDRAVLVEWERGGEKFSADITPQLDKIQKIGLIGVEPKTRIRQAGLVESLSSGFVSTWRLMALVFKSFGMLFSGEVSLKEGLGGPVRIAQLASDSARSGFGSLLMFTAFLSLNLAILNLLPIPALDGGHLLLLLIEAVIRRPVSTKIKIVAQQIGMALLLALMVFVIFNDVINLF
ncbi:RIP metalloprotease RseP [bacterium]|nr:RIP metalloprotease RseP [bacterium]